jgi:hypothetical protein
MKKRSFLYLGLSLLSTVCVANVAQAANPLGFAYSSTANVSKYARPTGVVVAGRCNRYQPAFAEVRRKGGEVLAYLNFANVPNHRGCAMDQQFYMGAYGRVPLWPWPSYGQREIFANTKMADVRKGGRWANHAVAYIEKLMRERRVDGVFLDTLGARPWGLSEWHTWSLAEKNAWTDGVVDFVRRVDAKRRAINPNFIIVNNNLWSRSDGNTRGLIARKYVDGITVEHPTLWLKPFHRQQVDDVFSNLGHRRVFVIARSAEEARAWAGVKGVTHVSNQLTYKFPTVPPVSFKALNDR